MHFEWILAAMIQLSVKAEWYLQNPWKQVNFEIKEQKGLEYINSVAESISKVHPSKHEPTLLAFLWGAMEKGSSETICAWMVPATSTHPRSAEAAKVKDDDQRHHTGLS